MKKEGNRPHFRSAAKRAAYDYLESQLKTKIVALRDRRWRLQGIAREIRELKSDIAGLNQVMQEYKK